jgi:hypothetical protein
MTDEEALRIIYAHMPPEVPVVQVSSGEEGLREKFRAGEIPLGQRVEGKTLIIENDKQLRTDHDRRIGLLKGEDKQATAARGAGKPNVGSSSGE